MEFSWTEDQLRLRSETAQFAAQQLNNDIVERDGSEHFDRRGWSLLAQNGVLRAHVPAEYGGDGLDLMSLVLMLEGLGYGCRDNGLTLAVNGQIWTVQQPIVQFGSEEQKHHYLPRLASGELLGAHAITEPESGSDSYSMSTSAEQRSGGYLINGVKTLIGMAPVCDVVLAFAKTEPDAGRWGISAFLIDIETDGVSVKPQPKMGLRTNPTGELTFSDCWIPESSILGPPGAGMSISSDAFVWERSFILASHVGAMERQLDQSIEYSKKRKQFGQPISQFQSVSNRLADMRLRLEAAKLLLYQSAWLKSTGRSAQLESALTKLHIAESFLASSVDSVRIHGGVGYLTEAEIERELRDAVGGVIYGGTSDIQRQLIARLLGT